MNTKYSGLNIHFPFEGYEISAQNIIFERFDRIIPFHSHGNGCYEIHFIPAGYGKLETNNLFYEITPNTLYVTGPHVQHAQMPISRDPMQEYCIYFKVRRLSKEKADSPLMDSFLAKKFWYGSDSQGLLIPMELLFKELSQQQTGFLLQAGFLLSQIILGVIRNYEYHSGPKKKDRNPVSGDNRSVIIEEYFLFECAHLSLDELSNRLKLSSRQTQRLLQEHYGCSFQQKKTESRMSAAAILLGEKTRTITAIAETLGYSSPEHFAAEFKKYYGTSPRNFRNRL